LPGVPHQRAVRAFEKAGFRVVSEAKHIVMSDGTRIITIPRHDPVNAFTMAGVALHARCHGRAFSLRARCHDRASELRHVQAA
jgi:hypothetical protein